MEIYYRWSVSYCWAFFLSLLFFFFFSSSNYRNDQELASRSPHARTELNDLRVMVAKHANRLPIDILTLLGILCVVDVVATKRPHTQNYNEFIVTKVIWLQRSDQSLSFLIFRLFSLFNAIIIMIFSLSIYCGFCAHVRLFKLVKQSIHWAPPI